MDFKQALHKYEIQKCFTSISTETEVNVNFADIKVNMNLLQFLLGFMVDEGPFKLNLMRIGQDVMGRKRNGRVKDN